jgi:quercetin dioxygenase-like cupin family protein
MRMSEPPKQPQRATQPFMAEANELPPALDVLGERITVLAASERTGGLELFRQLGEAGQGPPPHAHGWDETFYVVAGELEFGAGAATRRLGPGAVAHIPGGVTHWFRFLTAGEMLSVTSAAGASGLFTALDAAARAGPPDHAVLASVIREHGATLG